MKTASAFNRYVDFTVIEIEEGGASINHFRREDVMTAFEAEGWTVDRKRIQGWLYSSEPGDITHFQSGWIFHRIPK